jgi:murein L,D-transpeptidase YcbB/YkuD
VSTVANQNTKDFASKWDNALPSAVLSGIVGDAHHAANGGYHISIEDQPSSNYSVTRSDDKAPPGNWARNEAAAVDMSMSTSDMVLTYKRVMAVWSNQSDPRRKYVNAVNCFDGIGDAERLDFVSGVRSFATSDHKWHTHLEIRRRYVNDAKAMDAIWSMVSGEQLAAYEARTGDAGPAPTPPPSGGGDHSPGTRTLSLTTPTHMSGPDVSYVQNFIGPRHCGAADGDFGPKTKDGVIWYQRMRGLGADGIVGPITWSNMLGHPVNY